MQKTSPARDHLLSVSGLLIDDKVRTLNSGSSNNDVEPNSKQQHQLTHSRRLVSSRNSTHVPTTKEVTPQELDNLIQTQSLTNVTSSNDSNDADAATAARPAARVIFASDEWFATADNLLSSHPPQFVPDLYCPQGKVMDGWETRRKRVAGHDWAIIKLGGGQQQVVDQVWAVELDTAHFTGNHAPRVGVEVARIVTDAVGSGDPDDDDGWMPGASDRLSSGGGVRGTGRTPEEVQIAEGACRRAGGWTTVLPPTPLRPGYEGTSVHRFVVPEDVRVKAGPVTHVRVNYYPDGGVARMRIWGKVTAKGGDGPSSAAVAAAAVGGGGVKNDEAAAYAVSTILPRPVSVTSVINDVFSPTTERAAGASEEEGKLVVATALATTATAAPKSTSSWVAHSATPYHHPELSSSTLGGIGLACSDKHYGIPSNLIRPTYGKDMGDGWETARHPDRPSIWAKDPRTGLLDSPLMDWAVLKLGRPAASSSAISRIVLDTRHFKGNFPESVQVEGCCFAPSSSSSSDTVDDDDAVVCAAAASAATTPDTDPSGRHPPPTTPVRWFVLLPRTKVGPDAEHVFDRSDGRIRNGGGGPVTHVRVTIYPDGGLSRVRIYGEAGDNEGGPSVKHRSHL